MFNIHMLCADHGDCLWVEYGDADAPKRILIDAGTPGTYGAALQPKIDEVLEAEGDLVFELFVITHIDEDHIGGSVKFLDELDKKKVKIKEIWFNGYFHLSNQTPSDLGAKQAEALTALIRAGKWPWNKSFKYKAVMVPDEGKLPTRTIAGMKLTLLSPTFDKLQKLKPSWEKEIRMAGLVPGKPLARQRIADSEGFLGENLEAMAASRFVEDKTAPNGTSIAFIAEYDGKRVLFGADAHPSVLLESLERSPLNGGPLELDAFKLPHHGSKNNNSTPLLEAFPATHYLISTTGAKFKHPDAEAIARVVTRQSDTKVQLYFNCSSKFNQDWKKAARIKKYKYSAEFGVGKDGLVVEL